MRSRVASPWATSCPPYVLRRSNEQAGVGDDSIRPERHPHRCRALPALVFPRRVAPGGLDGLYLLPPQRAGDLRAARPTAQGEDAGHGARHADRPLRRRGARRGARAEPEQDGQDSRPAPRARAGRIPSRAPARGAHARADMASHGHQGVRHRRLVRRVTGRPGGVQGGRAVPVHPRPVGAHHRHRRNGGQQRLGCTILHVRIDQAVRAEGAGGACRRLGPGTPARATEGYRPVVLRADRCGASHSGQAARLRHAAGQKLRRLLRG